MRSLLSIACLCCFLSFHDRLPPADKKIVMAVFAHPDDEINVSALLSYCARQGNEVYLVIATKGEKGTRDHAGIAAGDALAAARKEEAACACKAMGIHPPIMLGMNDGELDEDFTGAPLHQKLDSIFRMYKPEVVVTWGPDGGYGHMDHRVVHNVVTEIFQAGDLAYPSTLYYTGMPTEVMKQLPVFTTHSGQFLKDNWKPVKQEFLSVRIPVSQTDLQAAIAAMNCHESQFAADERKEVETWMKMNKDTVYLRPFSSEGKLQFEL